MAGGGFGIGFQYKMLQTELWEEVPKQLSTDVGILFVPIDKLLIGMLIMNFPSITIHEYTTETKCFTSYSVQIGFQWEIINRLLIVGTIEVIKNICGWNAGIEYAPFKTSYTGGVQTTPSCPLGDRIPSDWIYSRCRDYLSSGFGSQYRTGFELFFLIRLDYETNVYKSVGISVNK